MKTDERQRALEGLVPRLYEAYVSWKEWEGEKNTLRDAFFAAADEAIRREGLAIKLVEFPAASTEAAYQRAERHNPGWLVQEVRHHRIVDGLFEIVLGENPTYMPFTYEWDGIKYVRTVSKGPVLIDDEWLQEEDSELYAQVTYTLPWGAVVPVPIEQLDKELLGRLARYIYNEKPRVSLARPRPVKEDAE